VFARGVERQSKGEKREDVDGRKEETFGFLLAFIVNVVIV